MEQTAAAVILEKVFTGDYDYNTFEELLHLYRSGLAKESFDELYYGVKLVAAFLNSDLFVLRRLGFILVRTWSKQSNNIWTCCFAWLVCNLRPKRLLGVILQTIEFFRGCDANDIQKDQLFIDAMDYLKEIIQNIADLPAIESSTVLYDALVLNPVADTLCIRLDADISRKEAAQLFLTAIEYGSYDGCPEILEHRTQFEALLAKPANELMDILSLFK